MARGAMKRDFFSILDDNIYEEKKDSVTTLKIANVEPRKDQPRKEFDSESLQLLADSVAVHGILQPIIVREYVDFPGTYEIIAGERRWRAAKIAGLSEIPVIVIDGDDLKVAQIALVENVQREDLNPVEEAFAYQALIERFGLTQEQLSKEVGRARPTIANMLRLTELPDEVLELLRQKKLTNGHARALLSLDDDEKMILLAQRIIEEDLSVRRVEEIVKKILETDEEEVVQNTGSESAQKRVYMRELEKRAMDKLGRRVKINQTTRKKTVELTFDTDSDLEELLCLICGDNFFAE
jgi:ParB family chromosome partitioning protein